MDIRTWFNLIRAASHREEGQTMAEYGVVLALITLAVIGVITGLGLAISGKLGAVSSVLNSVSNSV
jgi:Flp pilus assembly pilin Flp